MAEAIFSLRIGEVASLEMGDAIPGRISVDGFQMDAAIIDDIRAEHATNQQFNTSLSGIVYMYVFGDQMGTVLISGKLFSAKCGGGGTSGLEQILAFYKTNRASIKTTPIKVKIGAETLSGFLTRLTTHASGAGEASRIHDFTMHINTLPDDSKSGGGDASPGATA